MIISKPGCYTTSNNDPVVINADDVILDMKGQTLTQLKDPASHNKGIFISSGRTNVTIKNGTIRGFFYGIHFEDQTYSGTCIIENMFIQDCTFRGIVATGHLNIIRNNIITNINGTTVFPDAFAMGIECTGTSRIEKNYVSEIYGTGTGEAVHISSTDNGICTLIQDNTLFNKILKEHTYCIWVGGTSDAITRNNLIMSSVNGISYSSPTSGMVSGNMFHNVTNEYLLNGNVNVK